MWIARLREWERKLLLLLNGRYRTPMLDRIMKTITHLGGATFNIMILLMLTLVFDLSWNGLIAVIASHLVVRVLKRSFRRRRPYNMGDELLHFISKPLKDHSFPSGHTTAVFASNVSLAFAFPLLSPLLLIVACLVGWSRIYLGLHHPADVVVGMIIGGLTAVIMGIFFI